MKKMIILLTFIILTSTFATVRIDGYVDVCPYCEEMADCGKIELYLSSTGGSPIQTSCISPNGYYSFDVRENGTYYIEIIYARNENYGTGPGGCGEWWKIDDRVAVIVGTSDVTQDLCADEVCSSSIPETDPSPCHCESEK